MRNAPLLALLFLVACADAPTPVCNAPAGPLVDAPTVCAHLEALGCLLDRVPDASAGEECTAAYGATQAKTDATEFARLSQCYLAAANCSGVALCSLACVSGAVDAGLDAGDDAAIDAGDDAAIDAGDDAAVDAGP